MMCSVRVVPFSIIVNMDGAEGTLYSGEHYRVSFKFTEKYPFDSPGVSFCAPACVCLGREWCVYYISQSVIEFTTPTSTRTLHGPV